MEKELLKNLDNIDEKRYEKLLQLLDANIDTDSYFKKNYSFIMDRWHKCNKWFNIPNTIFCLYIDGNIKFFSNGNLNNYNIFDLASMTKLYTEYIMFCIIEEYNLSLETKIINLTNEYQSIKDLNLFDLVRFNNTFYTKNDIRKCENKNDAIEALRTSYIDNSKSGYYLYSDLPIMILTDVLESFTGQSYSELFYKYIINKHNLDETYLEIDNNKYITINKGYVNDPKANIMGGYYGHAGVKATISDFVKFMDIILNSKYLKYFISDANIYKEDGSRKHVGLIGNSNISDKKNESLASIYLPSNGFAVQGSVRCHAEAGIFKVNGKTHHVISCIFNDLYTQYNNVKKYEKETNNIISREYKVNNKLLKMSDIRKILPYDGAFKEIVDLVGQIRIVELNNFIKNDNI